MLVFTTVQVFESYLLLVSALQKCPELVPANVQTLTIKLDFQEALIDEYYSAHLAAEALASPSLRQMNIEVEQLS